MAAVNTCYISTGCNRSPFSADWGRNDIICYSSCRSVVLYHPEGFLKKPASAVSTTAGHTDRVNCVQWIRNPDNSEENELVSGSVDKTVRIWKLDRDKLVEESVLTGHTGAVTTLSTVKVCPNVFDHHTATVYLASASTDSTVHIWKREPGKNFEELQTLSYGSGFVLSLSLSVIPGTSIPILACGADDSKIHIYMLQEGKFVKKISLVGHEDWVRDVEFAADDSGDLLLASCSQDHFIRIWRFSHRDTDTGQSPANISSLPLQEDIKMRENTFSFVDKDKSCYYAVSLDSVLSGHENWIYSVRWQPRSISEDKWHQPMTLLSASMDKTMILWKYDKESGVWLEMVRVGEVGGNSLGFYGGLISPDGKSILAHGYHGAFHQWAYHEDRLTWESVVTGGGHFSSVQDMDWERTSGEFLVSVSEDQTTRLHAPWVSPGRQTCWYELARPQIHGYDLQCFCMIGRYQFVSGADEKVVRVFHAPRNFIENFCKLCGVDINKELTQELESSLPEGASVPALGLSNKAIYQSGETTPSDREIEAPSNQQYADVYFKPVTLEAPPSEENLLQNTLWPETQKLYGHGYEIFALAADPQGTVLATSCKASKAEFANIILWDTSSWRQICSLEGATLTVTQLTFSHDGHHLLAVSRDRTWTLYQKQGSEWSRVSGVDKKTTAHSRIIWAASWTHDDRYFVTVSRDKKAIVWSMKKMTQNDGPPKPISSVELSEAITAVDVAPCLVHGKYLVSLGMESGHIHLYLWDSDADWTCAASLSHSVAHHLSVTRLRFRPTTGRASDKDSETSSSNWLQLASCGKDNAVKVYDIDLTRL